jgi:GH18 family chitinase
MQKIISFFPRFIFSLILILFNFPIYAQLNHEVIGYYQGSGAATFPPANLDYNKYSTIAFAFYTPDGPDDANPNGGIKPDPSGGDITVAQLLNGTSTKIIISLGGAGNPQAGKNWAARFKIIANTPALTTTFVKACQDLFDPAINISFNGTHRLDGLDFDWEGISSATDMTNYATLLGDIRTAIRLKNSNATLSVTMSPSDIDKITASETDFTTFLQIYNAVDKVNIMTFNYNGPTQGLPGGSPGPNTPMYGGSGFFGSIDNTMNLSMKGILKIPGVVSTKVNIALAFYGQSFVACTSAVCPVAPAPVCNPGGYAPYCSLAADAGGEAAYRDIFGVTGFTSVTVPANEPPVLKKGTGADLVNIYYDDPTSIAAKCDFVINNSLSGVMIWEITEDYLSNTTSPDDTPLANEVNMKFGNGAVTGVTGNDPAISIVNHDPSVCAGSDLLIKYSYQSATFDRIEISDEHGIFFNPIVCQNVGLPPAFPYPPNQYVNVRIPSTLTGGQHYRLRIVGTGFFNGGGQFTAPIYGYETDFLAVNVPPAPTINLGGNTTACFGTQFNLNPVITGGATPYTYLWLDNIGNGPQTSPLSCATCANPLFNTNNTTVGSTHYLTLSVTGANGCTGTASENLTVVSTPPALVSSIGGTLCSPGNLTLEVFDHYFSPPPLFHHTIPVNNSSLSYHWYTSLTGGTPIAGATSSKYTAYFSSATTLYVSSVNSNGCESTPRLAVTATIISPPVAPDVARCGAGAVTLSASGAPLGGSYRWYTTSIGGTPILSKNGLHFIITDATYSPYVFATTTYYVSIVTSGCETARTPVTATIINNIQPPTILANGSRCGTGSVTLSVTGAPIGGYYKWYLDQTTTVAIASQNSSSYTTPSLSATTIYYVSIAAINCESTRIPITATINPIPNSPTVTPVSRCGTGTVVLTVSGAGANQSYQWYSVPSGGTPIPGISSSTFTTPVLSQTTSYYVSIFSSSGCEGPRAQIQVTVTAAPVIHDVSLCDPGQVTLTVTDPVAGETYNWYDASTGTLLNTGTSYSPTVNATTTYFVEAAIAGCVSTRTAVTASIGINGPELVTNGDFTLNGNGNVVGWSLVNLNQNLSYTLSPIPYSGNIINGGFYFTSGYSDYISTSNILTIGKTYTIAYDITQAGYDVEPIQIKDGFQNTIAVLDIAVGSYSHTFIATSENLMFFCQGYAIIDNVSIKEVCPSGTLRMAAQSSIMNDMSQAFVYPNPNNGVFNVSVPGKDSFDFVLYNSLGEEVLRESISGNSCIINKDNLTNGVYFLNIKTNGKTHRIKLMVSK